MTTLTIPVHSHLWLSANDRIHWAPDGHVRKVETINDADGVVPQQAAAALGVMLASEVAA